jgi:hypothetical protein
MLIDSVRQLGEEVEDAWGSADHAIDAFASIATRSVERFALHEQFNLDEIGEWLSETGDLAGQLDPKSRFGNPAITLWRNSRFLIDIYFWIDPETALHDHGFAGAFTNLAGESLHCVYDLDSVEEPAPGVILSSLDLQTVERLDKGSIRPILGGRKFVHRVWHISRPTVTMCVRTAGSGLGLGQYTYFYPHVGIEERRKQEEQDELLQKRLQFLSFLAASRDPRLERYVENLISNSDARQALQFILAVHDNSEGEILEHLSLLDRLLDLLEARYGAWIGEFASSLKYRLKENQVKWHELRDVDQRYLAAMLLTFFNRDEVIEGVSKYRGANQPIEWVIERLRGMVASEGLAVIVNDFQFSVLRDLILGRPEAEVVAAALADEGHGQTVADLHRLCFVLKQIDIFQPLFAA